MCTNACGTLLTPQPATSDGHSRLDQHHNNAGVNDNSNNNNNNNRNINNMYDGE
jgi:hypothetical protein